ncbi:ASCH domain-containing protein [Fusobacterium periodonticum]|uniref:ASCH domain-containing protein n=1 Tax=Fusobacterium periodonticum TaxID=860 RepID=UPI0028D6DE40|nr:ASCH domain-containing protein [Fusobacterium periodonticum]
MYKILLSIKPEYVKSIFEGKKKFEYRKIITKNKPTKIIIYSTYPVSAIVGEADVEEILIDSPDNLWKKTKKKSGVDKNFFFEYFKEKKIGVAYQLKNIIEYDETRSLEEFGVKCAPQSYIYL